MSNEDDFGSEEENQGTQGVADKNHLVKELFGEGSSDDEAPPPDPGTTTNNRSITNPGNSKQQQQFSQEFKRPTPEIKSQQNKPKIPAASQSTQNSSQQGTPEKGPGANRKRSRSVNESPPEDDIIDDSEPLSILPTFSTSIDNQDDLVIEDEQEIRVEEMPYNKPPEECPLHYFKLAGIGIDPRPFDENNFQSNDTEESMEKKKKRGAPNTIRWRYALDQDQQDVIRESNARVVKWSDGSMHLFVGKEAFGIHEQEFKDHHHLFIRQRKDLNSEAFLQCHGLLEKKMVLIPTDNSQIKKDTLQKLKNLKSLEASGIRRQFVASTNDPEKEKRQKEQLEDSKSDLRKQYGRDLMNQELTAEVLEEVDDEEREKAREARIMAAKVAALRPHSKIKSSNAGGSVQDNDESDSG